ncbi:MAG TPA: PqqD family protein [Phycisphaerae bacterium]|jgi:hypothetical protein
MLGFLEKKRPSREALLGAVPVRNPVVRESRREGDEAGVMVLRLTAPLVPSRLRGLIGGKKMAEKSFDLDALGAFVWESLDGRRNVEELIEYFAAEKRVNVREAEVAVLAFLKMLAQRNLLALAIERRKLREKRGKRYKSRGDE